MTIKRKKECNAWCYKHIWEKAWMKKPKPPPHEGAGQLVVKYVIWVILCRIDGKLTWNNVYLKVFPDSCSLCIFNSIKDSSKVKSSIGI